MRRRKKHETQSLLSAPDNCSELLIKTMKTNRTGKIAASTCLQSSSSFPVDLFYLRIELKWIYSEVKVMNKMTRKLDLAHNKKYSFRKVCSNKIHDRSQTVPPLWWSPGMSTVNRYSTFTVTCKNWPKKIWVHLIIVRGTNCFDNTRPICREENINE